MTEMHKFGSWPKPTNTGLQLTGDIKPYISVSNYKDILTPIYIEVDDVDFILEA